MPRTTYFAHSGDAADQADWHPLAAHLWGTGTKAAKFLEPAGFGDFGRVAGLLHDLGKYTPRFQRRLSGGNERVDHATAGAQVAVERFDRIGKMLAFCIAGHHAGLANGSRGEELSSLEERLKKQLEALDPVWEDEVTIGRLPEQQLRQLRLRSPDGFGFTAAFLIRMLFSALVDADFLDTEAYYDGLRGESAARGGHPGLTRLRGQLDQYLNALARSAAAGPINELRREILDHARGRATEAPGSFTLTVPTGGGKTLASLAFALDHAVHHGLARIIYVIPYMSIVEQTAAVFREALQSDPDDPADFVVEHHSTFDEDRVTSRDGLEKLRLAMQNWDAPIIVTTAVQFFDSLFANRPSRCRKLHNIAGSVVILDEAQTLPLKYLRPCVAALDELVRNWRTSVVLCTATQPQLSKNEQLPEGFEDLRELAPQPKRLYESFRRTRIVQRGPLGDSELAEGLTETPQVLCIVNTRRHARELYESLGDSPGRFHLSTLMCAVHRREQLRVVRDRLKTGAPVRLIATSLVEAGVDLDFPAVWRAEAGLESIIQAAGRCNREGRAKMADVFVFSPSDEGREPPAEVGQFADAARSVMRQHQDPSSLEAIRAYFRELYWSKGRDALDGKRLLESISERASRLDFPFETIAKEFHLVETPMQPVIIPYSNSDGHNGTAKSVLDKLDRAERAGTIARELQPYVVQVPPFARNALLAAGAVRPARRERFGDQFAVLTNLDLYRHDVGLTWDNPTFREAEGLVW